MENTSNSIQVRVTNFIVDLVILISTIFSVYSDCILSLFRRRQEASVANQVVVITGAGHGLGREMANLFASRGASVALIDINKDNVEAAADEINSQKPSSRAMAFICDISRESELKQTFSRIKNSLGPVDILINNAGIVQCKSILDLSTEGIKRTFDVNVISQFTAIRCVLGDMIARKQGHIVSVASIAGLLGTSNLTDYCASKFALVGMMKSLDIELHSNRQNSDIHLTTICPVTMSTGMFKSPKTRFDFIFPIVGVKDAAEQAVHSILTREPLAIIPKKVEYAYRVFGLLPTRVSLALQEFFQYGVDVHKTQ